MRPDLTLALLAVLTLLLPGPVFADSGRADPIQRGRYLTVIGHCNNCHTPGYIAAEGNVPEERWLIGSRIGWRSQVGTTYPTNLRLYFQGLSEDDWLVIARNKRTRPPMPWWSLRDTSDDDLRAIYRFVRALGPSGEPAPDFLPPDQEPQQPYWQTPMPKK